MTEKTAKPEIRFKGFSDAWEQRKLGDIAEKVTEKNSGLQYIETFTNSAEFGIISQRDFFDHDIAKLGSLGGYYIVRKEDFVYNPRISTSAPVGPINRNKLSRTGVMSPLYTVFRTHDVDTTYLEYFFKSKYWHSFMNINGDTGARADRFSIKDSVFFEMPIPIPYIEEQRKIGEYLTCLDNLITLYQRKYDNLMKVKKSMLEKMFPKNGETVPEIRFKGFSDDWEQHRLSDEFNNFIVPMRDKPKKFGGNIPWTRIEDIEGKYLNDSLSGQYVTEETVEQMNLKIIPKDSLIVSSSATFGVVAVITRDLITNQTFIGLVPNDKETIDYWYIYFQSDEARKNMRLESAGSTIFYIARESFEKMPVLVPVKREMIKIGAYFSSLDKLINLHQRKLEKLKNIKKACLEKMFV